MNNIHVPYTYRITFKPTNKHYYGVQYAKNCHPNNLWETYFTSSKIIHGLIEKYGKNSFNIEIRKTFVRDPLKAKLWESKVLRRINAATNINYINQNNSDGKFYTDVPRSIETKNKISKSTSGNKNHMYGKTLTAETKQKISKKLSGEKNPMYGKTHTVESRNKISKKRKGKKHAPNSKVFSEKHRHNQRERMMGENNPMYGKHRTTEQKEKISRSLMGHKQSIETCMKKRKSLTGINNGMYGKNHSTETKKKMSDSTKGKNHPNFGKKLNNHIIEKMRATMLAKPIIKCPHCNKKSISIGNMNRWHFDNCKQKS